MALMIRSPMTPVEEAATRAEAARIGSKQAILKAPIIKLAMRELAYIVRRKPLLRWMADILKSTSRYLIKKDMARKLKAPPARLNSTPLAPRPVKLPACLSTMTRKASDQGSILSATRVMILASLAQPGAAVVGQIRSTVWSTRVEIREHRSKLCGRAFMPSAPFQLEGDAVDAAISAQGPSASMRITRRLGR